MPFFDAIVPVRNQQTTRNIKNKNQHSIYKSLISENELACASIRHIQAEQMTGMNAISRNESEYLGQHMLAEFNVKPIHLTPYQFEVIVRDAAVLAGATVLCSRFFPNETHGGISGIVVIQESHFTVHYLPEKKFIAFDAFTCGHIDFTIAVDHIKKKLHEQPYDEIEFKRGIREIREGGFIPGIALKNTSDLLFFKSENYLIAKNNRNFGQHAIAEFYSCNPGRINDAKFVLNAFVESLMDRDVDIRFGFVHEFQPQGISAVVVGDGFHLTIHDWPEYGYGSVDLCTFNDKIDVKGVIKFIQDQFQSQRVSCYQFPRGNYQPYDGKLQPIFDEFKPKEDERPRVFGPSVS